MVRRAARRCRGPLPLSRLARVSAAGGGGDLIARLRQYWVILAITALFAVLFAVLYPWATGGDRLRDHSAYRKNHWGCAALAELAATARPTLEVDLLRRPLDDLSGVDGVLLIIDPERPFEEGEVDEVVDWVGRGGRLIVALEGPWDDMSGMQRGGGLAQAELQEALGLTLVQRSDVVRAAHPAAGSPLGEGVDTVSIRTHYAVVPAPADPSDDEPPKKQADLEDADEAGIPAAPRELTPHLVTDAGNAMVSFTHGRGMVYFSADAEMFANGRLDEEDNVVFVANLLWGSADDGKIYFDEFHHGYRDTSVAVAGVDPAPLNRAMWVAFLGVALFLFGKAVRFGAPVAALDPTRRTAMEYVEALAGLLHGARARPWALGKIGVAFRQRLSAASGIPSTAPPEVLATALSLTRTTADQECLALLRQLDAGLPGERLGRRELSAIVNRIAAVEARLASRAKRPGTQ